MAEPRPATAPRRDQARTIAVVIALVLAALFALLNLDEVEINWIVGTWQTPLLVVILVSFLLGAGVGAFVARRRRDR